MGTGKIDYSYQNICYSPSRPIDMVWSDCVVNGFMLVSKVFPYDVIRCVIDI